MRSFAIPFLLSALLLPTSDGRAQCGGNGSALLEIISPMGTVIGPGTDIILRLSGNAGELFCVLCDTDKGDTTIPGVGTFCLPFSSNAAVFVGVFPPSGVIEIPATLPQNPAFVGNLICCQYVALDAISADTSISNLVCICSGVGCEGRIERLGHVTTLDYTGPFPVTVGGVATKKDATGELLGQTSVSFDPTNPPSFPISDDGIYIVENIAVIGGQLSVVSTINALPLSSNSLPSDTFFDVSAGSTSNTQKIHTSCSRDIGVGFVFGEFTITELDSTEKNDLCAGSNKPQVLIMKYTGEGCGATSHAQDQGKVTCSGDPSFANSVFIRATDEEDPAELSGKIWFEGSVNLNGSFSIDATREGESRLKSKTFVHIFDVSGTTLLQTVEFHTSCSQPLQIGDQFGASELLAFIRE